MFINETTPEVVISTESIKSHVVSNDKEHLLNQAAKYLRADIEEHAKNLPELSWPINIDELDSENRNPPESVTSFLTQLLRNKDHSNREPLTCLIESYTSDLIHGVTRGKVITTEHFLLGLGLHNITGQRLLIQILHQLGHCVDYNFVCEIETAQAETAQMLATESGALPLKPASGTETVLTYFWVDNFDMNLETQTGKGALNSTHLVVFQEESQNSIARNNKIFLPRTKRRSLERIAQDPVEIIADPKRESPSISKTLTVDGGPEISRYVSNYMLWIVIRRLNTLDQIVSTFAGWNTHVKKTKLTSPLKKTVMTYLPPINSKVAELDTIYCYFEYLQQLAAEANMPYVNITLDVGAAMSVLKLLWNYPEKFGNVIIHLGDFHFIKENFSFIGKLVAGSGFEDAIFQADVCSSGSLNGVLSRSHYNRC